MGGRFPERVDVDRILNGIGFDATGLRDRALIRLAEKGLRAGEILDLPIPSPFLAFTIRKGRRIPTLRLEYVAKMGLARSIFVEGNAATDIARYAASRAGTRLFNFKDNEEIAATVRARSEQAGVPFRFHTFRHAAALALIKKVD